MIDFLGIPLLVAIVAGTETGFWVAAGWFSLVWAALVAVLLVRGFRRLRGTTLTSPCLWALLSVAGLASTAAISLLGDAVSGDVASPHVNFSAWRFATASLTFCPLMAVLGAKRPQDRGWQWVVLSLWIVVVWPAVQAVILPLGMRVELFIAWKLFLMGLIAIGLMNYLPTRHAWAALWVAVGQAVLFDEFLGNFAWLSPEWILPVGLACFACAAAHVSRFRKNDKSATQLESLSHRWQNFRDNFGAFWALRTLGQINQNAEVRKWPMRLQWSEFVTEDQQPTKAQLAELEQQMATLLRRFV